LEGAQTVPYGYTDCVSYNQAQDLLGDGWTIDVIAHILQNIKDE
jgi:DNA (cytosine-5)-methyltransferase 3A